jgi:hypothetical protein
VRVLIKWACAPFLNSKSATAREAALTLLIPMQGHFEHIEERDSGVIDNLKLYSFPQAVRKESEA